MRKLTYVIAEGDTSYSMVFITDRTPQWTESQYMRHRTCEMILIEDEPTDETEGRTYKLN
jgi:hypothetical protein